MDNSESFRGNVQGACSPCWARKQFLKINEDMSKELRSQPERTPIDQSVKIWATIRTIMVMDLALMKIPK